MYLRSSVNFALKYNLIMIVNPTIKNDCIYLCRLFGYNPKNKIFCLKPEKLKISNISIELKSILDINEDPTLSKLIFIGYNDLYLDKVKPLYASNQLSRKFWLSNDSINKAWIESMKKMLSFEEYQNHFVVTTNMTMYLVYTQCCLIFNMVPNIGYLENPTTKLHELDCFDKVIVLNSPDIDIPIQKVLYEVIIK